MKLGEVLLKNPTRHLLVHITRKYTTETPEGIPLQCGNDN
jgi:hypothetical protein